MAVDILLVAERDGNNLCASYKDLLGLSNLLSLDFDLAGIIMVVPSIGTLQEEAVDEIVRAVSRASLNPLKLVFMENPAFKHPNPPLLSDALRILVSEHPQGIICLPHSMLNCQVAASLSMGLNAAAITGVEALECKGGRPVFERSLMNGRWKAAVSPEISPCILTLNSGAFAKSAVSNERSAKVNIVKRAFIKECEEYLHLRMQESAAKDNSLDEAEVIVAAGRGISSPQELDLVRKTTTIFRNATLGASRPLCDSGRLPYACQIGETGRQVAPRLYLACGISGAPQHLAGMRGSQCVIAVNTDPEAAIFNCADYGIIADAEQFLPFLIKKYDEKK